MLQLRARLSATGAACVPRARASRAHSLGHDAPHVAGVERGVPSLLLGRAVHGKELHTGEPSLHVLWDCGPDSHRPHGSRLSRPCARTAHSDPKSAHTTRPSLTAPGDSAPTHLDLHLIVQLAQREPQDLQPGTRERRVKWLGSEVPDALGAVAPSLCCRLPQREWGPWCWNGRMHRLSAAFAFLSNTRLPWVCPGSRPCPRPASSQGTSSPEHWFPRRQHRLAALVTPHPEPGSQGPQLRVGLATLVSRSGSGRHGVPIPRLAPPVGLTPDATTWSCHPHIIVPARGCDSRITRGVCAGDQHWPGPPSQG